MSSRILAFVVGAGILVLTALGSLGGVLVAPIGMWFGRVVQRARGRSYTRLTSWVGAVVGCAIVLAGFFTFAIVRLPDGFVEKVQQETAMRQEDPSAMERLFQRAARSSPTQAAVEKKSREFARSKGFIWWVTIVGGTTSVAIAALLIGSAGWAGTALILFGLTGRWPGSPG